MKSLEKNNYQAIVISPEISKCCANKIHNINTIIPLSKQITLHRYFITLQLKYWVSPTTMK